MTILILVMCLCANANSINCNQFIHVNEHQKEIILVRNEVCVLEKNEVVQVKNKKGHPSFLFKDSVVLYLNIVKTADLNKVYIEIGNPHLKEVKLYMNGETIKSSKYKKRGNHTSSIVVKEHRNFRYELALTLDTTQLTIQSKTDNFWQPMPIIILKENNVRKFSVTENFILGSMTGVFLILILIAVLLILTIRNRDILLFSIMATFFILGISYELNSIYPIWFGANPKLDLVVLLIIFTGQVIVAELFIGNFIELSAKGLFRPTVKRFIQYSVLFRMVFLILSIVLISFSSAIVAKYIQYLNYVSVFSALFIYAFLELKNIKVINKPRMVLLYGFTLFSISSYHFVIQRIGILNFTYSALDDFGIILMPLNTTLPETFVLMFLILIFIATAVMFKEYEELKINKLVIEQESEKKLSDYPIKLVEAIEAERIRVSQGLHDHIGGLFSIFNTQLNDLLNQSDLSPKEKHDIKEEVDVLIQTSRDTSHQINPGALKHITLTEFFEERFMKVKSKHPEVIVSTKGLGNLAAIVIKKRGQVYRMISAILPSNVEIVDYKQLALEITENDENLELITTHNLKSGEANFESNFNKKIKSLLPIIEAYTGLYNYSNLGDKEYIVRIVLPKKYFYN